jgi:hypothetical protein
MRKPFQRIRDFFRKPRLGDRIDAVTAHEDAEKLAKIALSPVYRE